MTRALARRLAVLEARGGVAVPGGEREVDERAVLAEVLDFLGRGGELAALWADYRARGLDALDAEARHHFVELRGWRRDGVGFTLQDLGV